MSRNTVDDTLGHFTVWISLSLRSKTEIKPLDFGLSPELKLTNHCSAYHSDSLSERLVQKLK